MRFIPFTHGTKYAAKPKDRDKNTTSSANCLLLEIKSKPPLLKLPSASRIPANTSKRTSRELTLYWGGTNLVEHTISPNRFCIELSNLFLSPIFFPAILPDDNLQTGQLPMDALFLTLFLRTVKNHCSANFF